ncbi:hypothetical protein EUGRSUZ_I02416 [Eucalyptus grandis]|uniref:Uncharacterized protein n=2 Tax=Eucalyptus grandis TaxID=71139 RepID=A0ACC3JIQ3_EUCGR|nr:hypothetical protein EUGRSUZ_I02416 [Eucalyptus grandis]
MHGESLLDNVRDPKRQITLLLACQIKGPAFPELLILERDLESTAQITSPFLRSEVSRQVGYEAPQITTNRKYPAGSSRTRIDPAYYIPENRKNSQIYQTPFSYNASRAYPSSHPTTRPPSHIQDTWLDRASPWSSSCGERRRDQTGGDSC